MSYWNYRVIRKSDKQSSEYTYQIHEVYYADSGDIEGWTEAPVLPLGETVAELREDIRFFMKAFQNPILEEQIRDDKPLLAPSNDSQPINDGHYFEFTDRAYVAVDYIYQFLGSHPLMTKETKLREIYERAEKALAELYQEAGRLDYKRTKSSS
jgi:hypothetical protein